jgi:hypothetical protein
VAPIERYERISSAAAVWSGVLLAFLAGVRRGLTFSEAAGARNDEILSMLWVFLCGIAALLLSHQIPSLFNRDHGVFERRRFGLSRGS